MLTWAASVRALNDEGTTWLQAYETPTEDACQRKYDDLLARAQALGEQYALTDHPCRPLAKRILRHQKTSYSSLCCTRGPADNNAAEPGRCVRW